MFNSRAILSHLNTRMNQEHERLKQRLHDTYTAMARDITGDLWDACEDDGTGMGRQIGLAAYRASTDPSHTASLRFLHQKARYLEMPSHIQQLMQFNESKVHGEDTARVFAKAFGEGNIFDSATGSPEWREQRLAFQLHLFTSGSLTKLTGPMQEIITDYINEITASHGEISDIEDLTARFTMDMVGKTQLGFTIFPIDIQRALSPIIDAAIAKIANPKNSIETILPEQLVKGIRSAASYIYGVRSKSLDEVMEPGRQMLREVIKLNEKNILGTENWLTSVSIKKAWCRNKVETEALEIQAKQAFITKTGQSNWPDSETHKYWLDLTAKKLWPNASAKNDWFYATITSDWFKSRFNEITEKEWPAALASKSEDIVKILHSPAVLNDVALFLVVGHETSAKFFQYTLTLLADRKHAPVLETMREEILKYLAENHKTPEELTKKDIDNLPFSQAVLLESLRLFPPVPIMKAQTASDIVLGDIPECKNREEYEKAMAARDKKKDVHIRKGEFVFISPLKTHHSKAVYGETAEMFLPERFLDKNGQLARTNPNAWFPFGFGRRMCVGQQFAKQEVLFALVRFLIKFNFTVDDPLCYQVKQVFSLRPSHPVSAKVSEVDLESKSEKRLGIR
jgi:cytochrome P450